MYDDYDTQIQCEEMEGFIPTEEDYAEFTADVRNVRHDTRPCNIMSMNMGGAVKHQFNQPTAPATKLHDDVDAYLVLNRRNVRVGW